MESENGEHKNTYWDDLIHQKIFHSADNSVMLPQPHVYFSDLNKMTCQNKEPK